MVLKRSSVEAIRRKTIRLPEAIRRLQIYLNSIQKRGIGFVLSVFADLVLHLYKELVLFRKNFQPAC